MTKPKMSYVLVKSLNATKDKSKACLATKGQADKYKEFYRDMVPVDNKDLKYIGKKTQELKEKLSQGVDSLKGEIEDIDTRY